MGLPKIATPNFSVILPYSGKTLNCRPYLVKEDKILLMAAQSGDAMEATQAIKDVVNSCVNDDRFDISKLATVDADYLFMNIRAKSVGEQVEIEITCNNEVDGQACGKTFEVPINIKDLKMVDDSANTRNDIVKINKDIGVKMKPTSFKATLEMNPDDNDVDRNINILYNSIESIYDKEDIYTTKDFTKKEFIEWVGDLQTEAFSKMTDYINNLPVLVIEKEAKCPKCGFQHNLKFEDTMSFF